MKKEILQHLNARKSHFKTWQENEKEAVKLIPTVDGIIEQTDWEIRLIEHIPDDAFEDLTFQKPSDYAMGNAYLFKNYPLRPVSPVNTAGTASIYTASSSDFINGINHSEVDLSPWIQSDIEKYKDIQDKQNRFTEVHTRFEKFNPLLAGELMKSRDAYISAKQNITEKTYAGIAMRNVIEHFKGELFSKLPKGFRGKKKWVDMVNTLSIGTPGTIEFSTLLQLENMYIQLHTDLTGYAKNLSQPVNFTFDNIWAIYVDFLFITTGLIKI